MSLARASIVVFVAVALLTTLFMVKLSQGEANPVTPDSAVIPHSFGPYPNWALSPLTLPDATVTITTTGSHEVTATAQATVGAAGGANGIITDIKITNPGSGYTPGEVSVSITGAGTNAAATATVESGGNVVAVNVGATGGGYKHLDVAITDGGATTAATATAYGGVDAVSLANPGSGYTFPTVDFDMPDDPNGTMAVAHAEYDTNSGVITALIVDNPGSGYSSAPNVVIRDGTVMDPIRNNPGQGASCTATLKALSVTLDTFGVGHTSVPWVKITDGIGDGSGATATAAIDSGGVTAITITDPGSGYFSGGGIKKFQDPLPLVCGPSVAVSCPADWVVVTSDTPPPVSTLTKAIPLGVPVATPYNDPNGKPIMADEYEIGLVQQPARRADDLVSRPRLGRHQAECLRRRSCRVPRHRRHREGADRQRHDPRARRHDRARRSGQDLRPQRRAARPAGPHLEQVPLGNQGQPLVSPRVHAGPEPRLSQRHEQLRALDVRPPVLAAGDRHAVRTDPEPVLRRYLRPERPDDVDVPDRTVLRAAVDSRYAEHLGRHGTVQRHAARQRRGVS
jgi:hypothetical protein